MRSNRLTKGMAGLVFGVSLAVLAAPLPLHAQGGHLGAANKVCTDCHQKDVPKPGDSNYHVFAEKDGCRNCHYAHGSRFPHLLQHNVPGLCFTCHSEVKERSGGIPSHPLVTSAQCADCHEPHGNKNPKGLKKGGRDQCYTCHQDFPEFAKEHKKTLHPLSAGVDCILCHKLHDPVGNLSENALVQCRACHGNPKYPKISAQCGKLKSAPCLDCHEPHGKTESEHNIGQFQHQPFADGECDSCHNGPNSGDYSLTDKVQEVCAGCHDDIAGHSAHPTSFEQSCLKCHTAHAGSNEKRLRNFKETCLKCHTDLRDLEKSAKSTHLKGSAGKCTNCHDLHEGKEGKLWKAPPMEFCKTCHTSHANFGHPMGENVLEPETGTPVTCLSCHVIHGSKEERLLVEEKQRSLCIRCHKQL